MEHLKTVQQLVSRVRWRIKLQQVLNYVAKSGYFTVSAAAIIVILYKLLLVDAQVLWWGIGACVAVNVLALIAGLFKKISAVDAAAMLDAEGGLHSRLGTALAFAARDERTPMMDLAIADAAEAVKLAKPKLAAPMAIPAALLIAALASLFVTSGAVYYHYEVDAVSAGSPVGVLAVPTAKFNFTEVALSKNLKSRLAQEEKDLANRMKDAQDPEIKKMLAMLNKLIRDLQAGKLTLKEAFKRMAELDKKKAAWKKKKNEGQKDVANKMKKAAESLKKPNSALKPMLEAMKKKDMERAAKEMEKLAKKLDKGEMKSKDQRKIRKDMQKLADAMKSERQKREDKANKERDKLQKKQDRLAKKNKDRLKKKKDKQRLSKRDRDRLKRNKRNLDQLRREKEQQSEARRQLERLQREMDQRAQDEMRRQQGGQQQKMTAQQMRRAAEMMRRMAQQAKSGRTMRVAEGKMIDLKELMRRAGMGKNGQGKDGQGSKMDQFVRIAKGQGQGKDGQGKDGQGKDGQGMGKGQGKVFKPGGMGMGQGMGQGMGMGKGKGKGQGMGQGQGEGEGQGDGHDPKVMGKATNLFARHKESQLTGRDAGGQGQSRVVMAAAKKGFATRQYKKVHQDYSKVVEETLDRQEIPAGKRRYVRRYFDLIRPR